mmetsp:Transcript_7746/g.10985  ORF Transcript_7746/g.10985 Transcript_7746/m.10985 type:complete len:103 (+) Transcript_7746:67-375(+)
MVGCHSTATVPFPSVDPSAVPSSTSTTTLYNIWQSNLTVNSPTISSQSPVDQRTRSQGPFLGPTPCPHYGTSSCCLVTQQHTPLRAREVSLPSVDQNHFSSS